MWESESQSDFSKDLNLDLEHDWNWVSIVVQDAMMFPMAACFFLRSGNVHCTDCRLFD